MFDNRRLIPLGAPTGPGIFSSLAGRICRGRQALGGGKGAFVFLWLLLSGMILNAQAPPTINAFTATDASVVLGSGTTLNIDFFNGTGTLTPTDSTTSAVTPEGVMAVASSGVLAVYPVEDTTYTLTVTNETGGRATATLEVKCFVPARLIAAGFDHDLVYRADGSVVAWGRNSDGQLGDGTTNDPGRAFVRVIGLPMGIRALAAGIGFSMALAKDGTVWTWGLNDQGQLGDGTFASRSIPAMVPSLNGITAISAKNNHAIALKSDGTVWAWGGNDFGQLGDGSFGHSSTPSQVNLGKGVEAMEVVAGSYGSMALIEAGRGRFHELWAWGSNDLGSCATGATSSPVALPIKTLRFPGSPYRGIGAGGHQFMALGWDGMVWGWGGNLYGQANPMAPLPLWMEVTPTAISSLPPIKAITGGWHHTVALGEDASVWCWGAALVCGVNDPSWRVLPPKQVLEPMAGARDIAAGLMHTLVLLGNGRVQTFGHFVGPIIIPVPIDVDGLNSNIP